MNQPESPPQVRSPKLRSVLLALTLASLAQAALAQTPDISIGNASALEGNAGTTTLNVPVTRTGDTVATSA